MSTFDLTFDLDLALKLHKRYFSYEWKIGNQKSWIRIPPIVFILMIVLGSVFSIWPLTLTGVLALFSFIAYLLFYYIRYKIYVKRYLKDLARRSSLADKEYQWSYDETSIRTISKNFSSEVKWDIIKSYLENGTDLYLFYNTGHLADIISAEIMGEKNYEIFKQFVKSKLQEKIV